MRWCKQLIKDTEISFARFNNSSNTFEQKKGHIHRKSDYGTQTPITRQTLLQIEENNSVVLAPND